jgi:hypothetical protein
MNNAYSECLNVRSYEICENYVNVSLHNPGSISQSRDSGLASTGSRNPGAHCICHYIGIPIPDPLFQSRDRSGLKLLMPGSRRDYVTRLMTIIIIQQHAIESYSPQLPSHKWLRHLCDRVVLFYFRCKTGKKEVKQRSKEMQRHSTVSPDYMGRYTENRTETAVS